MTEPENIETDESVETSDPEEMSEFTYEEDVPQKKKGLGVFSVLGISLFVGILAALGGAYGAQYLTPPADFSALKTDFQKDMSEFRQDISQAKSEMKTSLGEFSQELDKMQAEIKRANSEDLKPALAEMQERLVTLENAPEPSVSDVDPETIRALKAAQKDGFKWPETKTIVAGITELKTETARLAAQMESIKTDIETVETKLEDVSTAPEQTLEQTVSETEPAQAVGPAFPKQALLNAAKARADSQGLFARTLHKHITVDSPDSPKNLIEKTETAYAKGDVYTAIKTFDRLPSDIRTAGQDWRVAADRLK